MFKPLFIFEAKQLTNRRNLIIMAIMVILSVYFCWDGIKDYRSVIESKQPFKNLEKEWISLYANYTAYGTRGIRILNLPSPISVIFNDMAVVEGMMAHVDTAEKLSISNSINGAALFSKTGGYMDFSGILMLLGTFIAMLYGFEAAIKKEFLSFFSDVTGSKYAVILNLLARVILFNLVFDGLALFILMVLLIAGIQAAGGYYLVFIAGLTLMNTFFIILGGFIGTFKKKSAQMVAIPAAYFLLVLLIPWMIQKAISTAAKNTIQSNNTFEYSTFKYVMDLEKRMYKKYGVWKSGPVAPDEIKKMIRSGQEVEYKKMREKELKRIDNMERLIRKCQGGSAIFPSTFYVSVNRELSSKGFQNAIRFYRYAYQMKQRFINFYIDRKFFKPLPKSGVEPFIKGNENIYRGTSLLPAGFVPGVIVCILWSGILLYLTWVFFQKPVVHDSEITKPESTFNLRKNVRVVIFNPSPDRISHLISVFQKKARVARVPNWPYLMSGIKVKWLFALFKIDIPAEGPAHELAEHYTQHLDEDAKASIIVELLRPVTTEIIVFNNFLNDLTDEFAARFAGFLQSLKKGKSIVYFTKSQAQASNIYDEVARFTDDKPL